MKKFILPLLIISLFLGSCNPWKYVGKADPEADFSTYKTFGLLNWEQANDKGMTSEVKHFILIAIKDQLEARGYTYQKKDADLQVSVFIIVNEETSYSAYADQYAGYGGWGGVAVGVGVGSGGAGVGVVGYGNTMTYPYSVVSHDYEVGAFVVDLLDNSKKKIIWQGLAEGRLSTEKPTQLSVSDRVNRIFNTLPVKKIKK